MGRNTIPPPPEPMHVHEIRWAPDPLQDRPLGELFELEWEQLALYVVALWEDRAALRIALSEALNANVRLRVHLTRATGVVAEQRDAIRKLRGAS